MLEDFDDQCSAFFQFPAAEWSSHNEKPRLIGFRMSNVLKERAMRRDHLSDASVRTGSPIFWAGNCNFTKDKSGSLAQNNKRVDDRHEM